MVVFLVVLLLISNGFYNTQSQGDLITIVEDVNFSANTIWYQDKLNLDQDFDLNFSIYLGELDKRGDGGTILLSATNDAPIGGEGGIIGALDIPDTLVFEFDTYFNESKSNILEQDLDTGLNPKDNNGHLGIIETNDIADKHKLVAYSQTEVLGNGMFRDVSVVWNSLNQVISYTVEGFETMSYRVDIERVFSGVKTVNFGFSSANGQQRTDTKVKIIQYPHQAFLKVRSHRGNANYINYNVVLTKEISHDKRSFGTLYLETNDSLYGSALVNGETVPVIDNKLILDSFTDNNLELVITVTTPVSEVNELSLTYQEHTENVSSEWVKDIKPPRPEVIKPPTLRPDESISKPVVVPIPEPIVIPKELEKTPEIEILPSIDKENVPIFHLDEEVNSVEGGTNLNYENYVYFESGLFGTFSGSDQKIRINSSQFTQSPLVQANEGYVFVGYANSSQTMTTDDSMVIGETYTAQYRKNKLIETIQAVELPWYIAFLVSLLLLVLRYVLNKDIKNREGKDGNV